MFPKFAAVLAAFSCVANAAVQYPMPLPCTGGNSIHSKPVINHIQDQRTRRMDLLMVILFSTLANTIDLARTLRQASLALKSPWQNPCKDRGIIVKGASSLAH